MSNTPSANDITKALDSQLPATMSHLVDETAAAGLAQYLTLLAKWNRVMNLVGYKKWPGMLQGLVVDSLYLASFLQENLPEEGFAAPLCMDLGAGAGIPGIPLRLVWPRGEYIMVDVREKRTIFLTTVLANLKLERTSVYTGRAEHILAEREPVDLIISRAFMPHDKLLPFVAPHMALGGAVVIMANDPMPEPGAESLSGWEPAVSTRYKADGKDRYLWLLTCPK